MLEFLQGDLDQVWSDRERELVLKYCEEIRQTYKEMSHVPVIAVVRKELEAQALGFEKIAKRFLMPREFFEPNHVIMVRSFADFVELSEFQYMIYRLKQVSNRRTQLNTPPTYQMIDAAIEAICGLTNPNYIIIPIAFFVELHMATRPSGLRLIQFERHDSFYAFGNLRLRIMWSNKYIKLNEIIVGSSDDSLWLFKSDSDERLKVDFAEEGQDNVALLVETIFRFSPPQADRVSVMEFPENLCQIR